MKLVKCVDCHRLCARLKRSREPFETASTQLREKLKQPDPWSNYSLSREYDFRCHKGRESFNDYPRAGNLDKIVEERECGGFREFDPCLSLDQMKEIDVLSQAMRESKIPWWKDARFLIPIVVAIGIAIWQAISRW